jgi:hypothetical protein
MKMETVAMGLSKRATPRPANLAGSEGKRLRVNGFSRVNGNGQMAKGASPIVRSGLC